MKCPPVISFIFSQKCIGPWKAFGCTCQESGLCLTVSPYLTLFPFLCTSQWRSSWRTIILWEEPGYQAASKPRRWSSTGARAMVPTARSTASMAGDSLWRWAPTNLSPTSVPYLNNPAPQSPNSGLLALFCGLCYFLQLHSYLGLSSQEHSSNVLTALSISNGPRFVVHRGSVAFEVVHNKMYKSVPNKKEKILV